MTVRSLQPNPLTQYRTQFGHRDPKRRRDLADVDQGRVPLAPLDSAYVGVVQTGLVGEFFLGEPTLFPQFAHPPSERRPQLVHDRIVSGLDEVNQRL